MSGAFMTFLTPCFPCNHHKLLQLAQTHCSYAGSQAGAGETEVFKPTKKLALLCFFILLSHCNRCMIGMASQIIKSNETSNASSTNASYIHHYRSHDYSTCTSVLYHVLSSYSYPALNSTVTSQEPQTKITVQTSPCNLHM